ncbi:hypothetical protein HD554DRAFT_2114260 [Boletus coccyginus]|nr:hypothetical protein HD554DRAFT_2114260 [Boletus coccyginus]
MGATGIVALLVTVAGGTNTDRSARFLVSPEQTVAQLARFKVSRSFLAPTHPLSLHASGGTISICCIRRYE